MSRSLSVLALFAVLILPQFADAGVFRSRRGGRCSGGVSACAPVAAALQAQFSGGACSRGVVEIAKRARCVAGHTVVCRRGPSE